MSASPYIAVENGMDIPLFKPGKGRPSIMSAADMNVLVRALTALTNPEITRGEHDKIELSDGNLLITIGTGTEQAIAVARQFILKDYSNPDWFVCREWDGFAEVSEADIPIAKPWSLRQTPFDGLTMNYVREVWNGTSVDIQDLAITFTYRTATLRSQSGTIDGGAAVTEDQVIIPRYKVDSDIICAANVEGLGIVVDDVELKLLALNDGRAWMKQSS